MSERVYTVIAWIGLASLIFGVIPYLSMSVGYFLEEQQVKPTFLRLSCHAIETELQEYQSDYGVVLAQDFLDTYDPKECVRKGQGVATVWIRHEEPSSHGFLYGYFSEDDFLKELGYRPFFHNVSEDRWFYTLLLALPWLPLVLLLYIVTGSPRILPWKQVTNDD